MFAGRVASILTAAGAAFVLALQVGIAIDASVDPWWLASLTVGSIVALSFVLGMRYGHERAAKFMREVVHDVMGPVPREVRFHYDESSGHVSAFVTTIGGDPQVVEVPDEIAAHGPHASLLWLMEQGLKTATEE